MPGVTQRVGDGLLGDAIARGPDRWAEVLEVARQVHLDQRLVADRAGEPPDVGCAHLGSQVGIVAFAQGTHHGPHLGESTGTFRLDDLERLDRGTGSRLRDHASRLRTDHHRRDVVRHSVVQLASQLLALAQSDLVQLAQPRGCQESR